MSLVINTNAQALQNANNLNLSSARLTKSLARLSSGSRIISPSDDAAGLAVSSRLQAQIARLDSALSNVINAVSFTQTQDGFMKTIDKAFRRMGELAMLAQDGTKSEADRALYQQEFSQLKDYISETGKQKFNDVELFSDQTLDVTVDSSGSTFGLTGINMEAVSYANAVEANVSIATSLGAVGALVLVKDAISQIAIDRAKLGALQARLNFTNEQLMVTKENLSSAVSRIADTDVAQEATEYARNQILVQSGTSMLAQANSLPQSALRLLQ
jgi:flagellin